MTRFDLHVPARGLCAAFIVALTAALMLAAPAQAQRTSINSLAADHDDILEAIENLEGGGAVGGPTPIDSCQSIIEPGSYLVVGNLTTSFGRNCLTVTVDNVTIDLGGHVLDGANMGDNGVTSDGTSQSPRTNVTVHNGTVTRFVNGIELENAVNSTVRHVRAVGNSLDGIVAGDGGTVSHNIAADNGIRGIRVGRANTVVGNTAQANSFTGIVASQGSTVSGNTAAENGSAGFIVGLGSTVTGNRATENGSVGFFVGLGSTVTGNTASENGTDGFSLAEGSTVSGNTASRNGFGGIFAGEGSTVSNNTARFNDSDGLIVVCPSNVFDNTATRNGVTMATAKNLDFRPSGTFCLQSNNLAP